MKQIFQVCILSFFVVACNVTSRRCIQKKDFAENMKKMEQFVDQTTQSTTAKTSLLEETCTKMSFERAGYKFIFYKDKNNQEQIVGLMNPVSRDTGRNQQCLDEGVALLLQKGPSYSEKIISKHQQIYKEDWKDMDVGPIQWLRCQQGTSTDFNSSVSIFLHELNHGFRNGKCLYLPSQDLQLCFNLSPNLPKRSVAKLDTFPTKDKRISQGLQWIQNTYLTNFDEGPLHLFDELNAYIVTADVLSSLMIHDGINSIFYEDQTRDMLILPLFLLYTVRYLDELNKLSQESFQKTFERGSENLKNVRLLLDAGEKSYHNWQKSLASYKKPEKDIENKLWQLYQKTKKRIPELK